MYITLTTVNYAEEIAEELNHTYFLQIRAKIQISGSFMDNRRFVLAAGVEKGLFENIYCFMTDIKMSQQLGLISCHEADVPSGNQGKACDFSRMTDLR